MNVRLVLQQISLEWERPHGEGRMESDEMLVEIPLVIHPLRSLFLYQAFEIAILGRCPFDAKAITVSWSS